MVNLLLDAGADSLMPGSAFIISTTALCAASDSTEFLPAMLQRVTEQHDIFHASVLGETVRVSTLLEKDPSLVTAHHEGAKIWTIDKGRTPLT